MSSLSFNELDEITDIDLNARLPQIMETCEIIAKTVVFIKICEKGFIESARTLLSIASNTSDNFVNAPFLISNIPLHIASKTGNYELTCLLIDHGAQIDRIDKKGRTAFTMACIHNHVTIAKKLVEHGANVDHMDAGNITALESAMNSNSAQVVEYITGIKRERMLASNNH